MQINLPKCLNLEKRKFKAKLRGKHIKGSLKITVKRNKIVIEAELK